jgi:hypothetical protein
VSLLPQDRRVVEVMNAQDGLYTVLIRHPDGTTRHGSLDRSSITSSPLTTRNGS